MSPGVGIAQECLRLKTQDFLGSHRRRTHRTFRRVWVVGHTLGSQEEAFQIKWRGTCRITAHSSFMSGEGGGGG